MPNSGKGGVNPPRRDPDALLFEDRFTLFLARECFEARFAENRFTLFLARECFEARFAENRFTLFLARSSAPCFRSGLQMAHPLPVVGVIMGSKSDWETLKAASKTLDALGVAHETKVVSAHRTPERLYEYARGAKARGLKVIIAGAGGAAHLPGMTAALTPLPILGVPVASKALSGVDSLLSIVQMPKGVPVGTLAIGEAGAVNAALLAAAILALSDEALATRLDAYRAAQTEAVGEAPA
jgi:5-(carboxyamino)imidazole ribonucleotide mutase